MVYIRERRKKATKYIRPRKSKEIAVKLDAPTLIDQIRKISRGIYKLDVDGISQSLMSNWACRIKFILKLTRWTTHDSGKTTYFGNIAHYVLERIYQRKDMPFPMDIKHWVNEYIRKNEQQMAVWTDNKIELAAGMAEVVLINYCEYYYDDFKKMKFKEVESIFEIPFHNTILKGMRDLFFYYSRSPILWFMEHKTMGRVSENILLKRLPIDKQILFYIISSELDLAEEIGGCLFNVIRRPQLKPHQNEDLKDFLDRLEGDILGRPSFYYLRYPVVYSKMDKWEYKQSLILKLNEIEEFLKGNLDVYREEEMCESAYNGSPYVCEYIDVCRTGLLKGFIQQSSLFPELER